MTKDNAELIATARLRAEKYASGSDAYMLNRLVAAIEAAEAETDTAKTVRQLYEFCASSAMSVGQALSAAGVLERLANAEAERDAALAKIAAIGRVESWPELEDILGTPAAILNAGSDVMAEAKAEAWDEGFDAGRDFMVSNPYRTPS